MARSHTRRITRKELRQPDRFQVATEQALEFYQTHTNLVYAAIGALVLMGVVIFAWQMFKEGQNTAASRSSPTQPSFIKRKNTVKRWRPFKKSSNTVGRVTPVWLIFIKPTAKSPWVNSIKL